MDDFYKVKKKEKDKGDETGWYLSREILYFEHEDISLQRNYLVWENLILIKADTRESAFIKAMKHGEITEGKVTINEKEGNLKFLGLKELIPIYEEFADGSEIEWSEYEVSKKDLGTLALPKKLLSAFSE